jgi:hypothetical protein
MNGPRAPKSTSIGPMSKNSANVPHFIAPRQEFDIPQRVTNASSRQSLDLSKECLGQAPGFDGRFFSQIPRLWMLVPHADLRSARHLCLFAHRNRANPAVAVAQPSWRL